ncbi:MAG: HEAT repeat domain-containing protein [Polyangiales bacterium]
MFAIPILPGRQSAHLDFEERFDLGVPAIEPHLRWVLASYDARRDEQWVWPPHVGAPVVDRLLAEGRGDQTREIPALRALGWYGIPEHFRSVVPYTDHPDEEVRRAAIHALGQLVHFDTIPLLQAHLASDASHAVQLEALGALGKMGKTELLPDFDIAAARGPDFAAVAAEARARTRATAQEGLEPLARHLLQSSDYEDLCVFMTFVFKVPLEHLVDPAMPMLPRLRAARLLGLTRQRRSFRALGTILANPSEPEALRMECAVALGRLEHPKAVEPLVTVLDDPATPPDLQLAVLHALGRTGSPRAIAPLLRHWDDRGGAIRDRVRLAVRDAGRREDARTLLDQWLWNEPVDPQQGGPSFVLVDPDRYTDRVDPARFIALLDDPGPTVRRDALLLLAYAGDRSHLPRIERVTIEDPIEENRWLAAVIHRRISARPIP